MTKREHYCWSGCVCPIHKEPWLYSKKWDLHACRDPECEYAHGFESFSVDFVTMRAERAAAKKAALSLAPVWNSWAPDALSSPLAPRHLVEAYNHWQPEHLKIRES